MSLNHFIKIICTYVDGIRLSLAAPSMTIFQPYLGSSKVATARAYIHNHCGDGFIDALELPGVSWSLQLFAYGLTVRGVFVDDEKKLGLRHKPCFGSFKRTKWHPRSPKWP